MSERQRETAFLKRLICCEDTAECRQLQQTIVRVQSDARCVQRAVWLMALFILLAAAGAAYGGILFENFPHGPAAHFLKAILALGLTGLVCLAAFLGLLNVYRRKLNRLRSECRRIVMRRIEPRPEPGHLHQARVESEATFQSEHGGSAGAGRSGSPVAVRGRRRSRGADVVT